MLVLAAEAGPRQDTHVHSHATLENPPRTPKPFEYCYCYYSHHQRRRWVAPSGWSAFVPVVTPVFAFARLQLLHRQHPEAKTPMSELQRVTQLQRQRLLPPTTCIFYPTPGLVCLTDCSVSAIDFVAWEK